MYWPRFLPEHVLIGSFRARNGELGVLRSDVEAFLDACQADGIEVSGWEVWLADHAIAPDWKGPVPAAGSWCGLIPIQGRPGLSVLGGNGNRAQVRRQIATDTMLDRIEPSWTEFVRINFSVHC